MSNHEHKNKNEDIHLFLAFKRNKYSNENKCRRHIIKYEYEHELKVFESELRITGGNWRIHRTVNARSASKALKWLQHRLIDHPEQAPWIDSLWRTALLQRECRSERKFLIDIDTKDEDILTDIALKMSTITLLEQIETPNGWHFISSPFDNRIISSLDYVSVLHDAYYFVKEVMEEPCAT